MSDMSDSDEDFEDSWVAPPSRKGKKKAKGSDAGAGPSSSRGGGAQKGEGKRTRRKAGNPAADKQGSHALDSPESMVKMLPRSSLEELLRRVIDDQEMVTAADVRALLPTELPDPTRPRPMVVVVADETSNELGRFSRIPQTIIVGVLLRVPLRQMLPVVTVVCKGFRALWGEPLLFQSLTCIDSYLFSAQGVMRLLDKIPGKGEQVTQLQIGMGKMDSKNWITILKQCPNLVFLDLDGKKIGTKVIQEIQKQSSKLTWLALPKINAPDLIMLLKSTPKLKALKLQNDINQPLLNGIADSLSQARGGIPLLEELYLEAIWAGMPWEVVASLGKKLPEIRKLSIRQLDSFAGSGFSELRSRYGILPAGVSATVFQPMLHLEKIEILRIGTTYGPPLISLPTPSLTFFLEKLIAAVPNVKHFAVDCGRFYMSQKNRKGHTFPPLADLNGVLTRCKPLLNLEQLELGNMDVTLEDFTPPFSAPKLHTLKLHHCGPHAPSVAKAFFEDELEVFSKGPRMCFGQCGCEHYGKCKHETYAQPEGLRGRTHAEVGFEPPDVDM